MFGECVPILAVDLSVLIYQGNNELLGLRNGCIVNLMELSCCISHIVLPSLKGHRSCNDQGRFVLWMQFLIL